MNTNQAIQKKLKIYDYDIHPIPTGIFGLDGGAMFGTVPKVLWEKAIPADNKNRIPMEARALLLKGKNKNILIDTGNGGDFIAKYGEKLGSKFAEMYNIDPNGPSLEKSLNKFNLKTTDITDVILTHLHFDHAGGATKAFDSLLKPTFPNAQYYVQRKNLETASNPNLRERASYFKANFQPLLDAGVLKILDGDVENILPGISVFVSNGHTQGQQIVQIKDQQNTLMYCGDVVPTSAHTKIAWLMGYDLNPLLLMEEKQRWLSQAAEKKWYLFFEHDPFCDAAQITANGQDFALENKFLL